MTPYEPPTGDEPLDTIEQALVKTLVRTIAAEIREELAAEAKAREAGARQVAETTTPCRA